MKKTNIGLIGLGNVGSELFKMLQKESGRFQVLKIAVRDKNKERKVEVDKDLFTENVSEIILNPHIDVIADASNDAPENIFERIVHKKDWVPQAVYKRYVLASKKTMAFYGEEILEFAKANNIEIGFEATVCAGIPIVRLLREGHIPEKVLEVGGILNGTTNHILTRMHQAKFLYYEDALREAQKRGYAEANPTEDVSGLDSVCKLIILSGLCWGKWQKFEEVGVCGIERFPKGKIVEAAKNKERWRLVASAKLLKDENLKLDVRPIPCGDASALMSRLRRTDGVENLIYLKTESRTLYFNGPGAGGKVTAAAMMSDLNCVTEKLRNGRT